MRTSKRSKTMVEKLLDDGIIRFARMSAECRDRSRARRWP
jgi:hypothetical protein